MKVNLLGTGSIYSKSNCASLIIDNNILIDIGPGVVKQLLKQEYDLSDIDTILITHLHSDHILEFPVFICNIDVLGIDHKINMYTPKGGKTKFLELLDLLYGEYFNTFVNKYINFIEITDNMSFNISEYTIKVREVIHAGFESYGFVINNKLGITGDSQICESVEKIFNETEVLICDCSKIEGDVYHMGFDNVQKLHKYDFSKKIILTHFRDETKEYVKTIKLDNIFVVEDGDKFEL